MHNGKTEELRLQSIERLRKLQSDLDCRLGGVANTQEPEVCIYATGSLAREEANPASDLDAFFLLSGNRKDNPLGRIRDVKILNRVVDAVEGCGFPDFSNDGEFLEFIHIQDLLVHLGDREDDYQNMLTARMLLILESKPLYNEPLYNHMLSEVIGRYFSDFHKHYRDFKPIFLLNDILRFWRTLCLNYENGRQWRTSDAQRRAKGHLSNLKLRYSRCNTCFSFVAKLLSIGPTVEMNQVIQVCNLTPLQRLREIQVNWPELAEEVDLLFQEYDWFLVHVSQPKAETLDWISERSERDNAFDHANRFIEFMYRIVSHIAEKNKYMRYLAI